VATLLHRMIGDVYLIVRSARPTPDDEFDTHVTEIPRLPGTKRAVLVYFAEDGLSPSFDAKRRARLSAEGHLVLPHALVANSDQVKGFATAFRWMGSRAQAFGREELEHAFDFLTIPSALRVELRSAIHAMVAELERASPRRASRG
jgi:hypothetical protein